VDLLRADLVPESYVPDKEHRELRQLARTRIDLVHSRTTFKEKMEAIMAKYEFTNPPVSDIFSAKGTAWLRVYPKSSIIMMFYHSF